MTPLAVKSLGSHCVDITKQQLRNSHSKVEISEISITDNLPHYIYLSPSERKALQELKCNTDLIINKVGKGSTIVVQNMADYIKDALQHLNDPDTYRVLDGDPTSNICNTLETTSPTPFTKFPIQGNH